MQLWLGRMLRHSLAVHLLQHSQQLCRAQSELRSATSGQYACHTVYKDFKTTMFARSLHLKCQT